MAVIPGILDLCPIEFKSGLIAWIWDTDLFFFSDSMNAKRLLPPKR